MEIRGRNVIACGGEELSQHFAGKLIQISFIKSIGVIYFVSTIILVQILKAMRSFQ